MNTEDKYPWKRTNSHHYVTTENFVRNEILYDAGFRFQVSIPPVFHKLPIIRTIIHDPGWLVRARNHDADLNAEAHRAWTAICAAWHFLIDVTIYPTRHKWLLPVAFFAILLFTTGTRLFRTIARKIKNEPRKVL